MFAFSQLLSHKYLKEFNDEYQDIMTSVAQIFYTSTQVVEQTIEQNRTFNLYDTGINPNHLDSMFELENENLASYVNFVEETLTSYDGQKYSSIKDHDLKIQILVQVLKLTQATYLPLSLSSLYFWQNIMRDMKYKLPNDCLVALLSILAKQFTIFSSIHDKILINKEQEFPGYFDTVVEFKVDIKIL